ncbi:hypothetical protein FB45DRAFT_1093926 [Roridomyces roridus]|uniref:Uncharacterized protein n=1 Tax=Roridomyces roridus TaxID=1738132 RepID=A0AAD7AXG5_9AGAR|nr:hypothetical protein FB45DRAFT_1093926 [Roridomyces roridus]
MSQHSSGPGNHASPPASNTQQAFVRRKSSSECEHHQVVSNRVPRRLVPYRKPGVGKSNRRDQGTGPCLARFFPNFAFSSWLSNMEHEEEPGQIATSYCRPTSMETCKSSSREAFLVTLSGTGRAIPIAHSTIPPTTRSMRDFLQSSPTPWSSLMVSETSPIGTDARLGDPEDQDQNESRGNGQSQSPPFEYACMMSTAKFPILRVVPRGVEREILPSVNDSA